MGKIEIMIGVVIMSLPFGFIAGAALGEHRSDASWQKELIERGYAEYNTATGEWQWKEGGK